MTTTNLGMGACGFGSTACGFGSPAQTNSSTASLLRQLDGTPGNCALIDTVTGDYVLDATGQNVGWDSIPQRVYLALRTVLGSSAVSTMGIEQVSGVINANFTAQLKNAVRTALRGLTDAGLIEIVDVVVTRVGTSAVSRVVTWRVAPGGPVHSTFV